MLGSVKWFNETKGYGFVTSDDDGKDYFIHRSFLKPGLILQDDDRISFKLKKTQKGLQAINIVKV